MAIILIALWFIQDFLQVMLMGFCLVPDLFLVAAIFMAIVHDEQDDRHIALIWGAFFAGLVWDLRWTNLPGLTAAVNGLSIAAAWLFWHKSPAQGRSTLLFAFTLEAAQLFSGVVHSFFWTAPGGVAIRQFMVQQLIGVPVLVIASFLFWKGFDRNV